MSQKVRAFIPKQFISAHDLCFLNHDVLAELLRSGEQQGIFWHSLPLRGDDDRRVLEETGDIFDWLEKTGRTKERGELLRRLVFPALLSDFLHFIYESLQCARKAKLTVAYALLRKPLQETLFVFEKLASDLEGFSSAMANDPVQLHSQNAGGVDVHIKRISKVLQIIDEANRFNATYLAQLRYDKTAQDGFDGVSNQAIHLFTHHPSIRTEQLNINFIFSGEDSRLTQWNFLYSRLPYILGYSRCLVEYVCSTLFVTDPVYLRDIDRRISASILIWEHYIESGYRQPYIEKFIEETRSRLYAQCRTAGYGEPEQNDLIRMSQKGVFPGESLLWVMLRNIRYYVLARLRAKRWKWFHD